MPVHLPLESSLSYHSFEPIHHGRRTERIAIRNTNERNNSPDGSGRSRGHFVQASSHLCIVSKEPHSIPLRFHAYNEQRMRESCLCKIPVLAKLDSLQRIPPSKIAKRIHAHTRIRFTKESRPPNRVHTRILPYRTFIQESRLPKLAPTKNPALLTRMPSCVGPPEITSIPQSHPPKGIAYIQKSRPYI